MNSSEEWCTTSRFPSSYNIISENTMYKSSIVQHFTEQGIKLELEKNRLGERLVAEVRVLVYQELTDI